MRLTPSLLALALALSAQAGHAAAPAPTPDAVVSTYADIAAAAYGDSLTTARALQSAVAALVAAPSAETLDAARRAWIAARAP